MKIHKSILIPAWNEELRQQIISFWQERRFVFSETSGDTLYGRRGNIWGNLTSFDMSKLIATLTISKTSPTEISCILNVNTLMQDITEWNEAYWQLELDTLESWILRGDKQGAEWQELLEGSRKAAIRWAFSYRVGGRKMPPKV